MTINLDLLADVLRLRFEGSDSDFHAALDAAYPVVCDAAGPDWDDTPTDFPGTDSPTDGPEAEPDDGTPPRYDGTDASYLARAYWAQARVKTWPGQGRVA